MIPNDALSRLRLAADASVLPTAPTQKLSDVLSDLIPGQRLMAQIQALLTNGSYRATVAQREIVLALPFAAKSGDTLELEVQELEGKLTLAFVGKQATGAEQHPQQDSVASNLSRTGQMIADLLPKSQGKDGQAKPVPLNAANPLLPTPPQKGVDIAPALRQAISQSGMFYEAHQAQWVSGSLPKEALFAEPQGRLSTALQTPGNQPTGTSAPLSQQAASFVKEALDNAGGNPGNANDAIGTKAPAAGSLQSLGVPSKDFVDNTPSRTPAPEMQRSVDAPPSPVKLELAPIVQNQLEALATQNFSWQGQVWPGQQMDWDITANPDRKGSLDGEEPESWKTQLRLRFPSLGGVDAVLSLKGNSDIEVSIRADNETTRHALRLNAPDLVQHLADAGLKLNQFGVSKPPSANEQIP